MMNLTEVLYFSLTVYFPSGPFSYIYFVVVLVLYLLVLCSNVVLVAVICVNRSLHQPMYVLLCSLFVNELYGSTGLFPFLLLQILSDLHTVSASFCFLQIFCIYTYANVEFCNLAVMSYDRYVAICRPLQYHTLMTPGRMAVLLLLTWLYPVLGVSCLMSLTVSLQLCGNTINKVYCDNYSIVKLSCSDTTVNNIYGMIYTAIPICVVLLIICSYMRILHVCFSGSKQTRQKALSTCSPHLASLLNFSCGCFFEIVQNRFNMTHVPQVLRVVLSLYWLACQPLFNPLVYGLNLTRIRVVCRSLVMAQEA